MNNLIADAVAGAMLAGLVYYFGTRYGTGRCSD